MPTLYNEQSSPCHLSGSSACGTCSSSGLCGLRPAERARLLGSVRTFVTNDAFVNAVSGLNINDSDHKNARKSDNIFFVAAQLQAFNEVPGLAEQVKTWLSS